LPGLATGRDAIHASMKVILLLALALSATTTANAQTALPVPRQPGGCPTGYSWQGAYCIPLNSSTAPAIPRLRTGLVRLAGRCSVVIACGCDQAIQGTSPLAETARDRQGKVPDAEWPLGFDRRGRLCISEPGEPVPPITVVTEEEAREIARPPPAVAVRTAHEAVLTLDARLSGNSPDKRPDTRPTLPAAPAPSLRPKI
jgi:hypothetical protein